MKSPKQEDKAQRKVKKENPRKCNRKLLPKIMSENYDLVYKKKKK